MLRYAVSSERHSTFLVVPRKRLLYLYPRFPSYTQVQHILAPVMLRLLGLNIHILQLGSLEIEPYIVSLCYDYSLSL